MAFGVISDTARREIGFNVYFFRVPVEKKKVEATPDIRERDVEQVFLDSCFPCHRNSAVSITGEVAKFPRGPVFFFISSFLIAAAHALCYENLISRND